MRLSFTTLAFAAAILFGIAPLWAGEHLPLVDLPQHLHLISVLHRLNDASTLYPEWFTTRGQLTPYMGYYYLVSWLNWLMPLTAANKVFLSAYVAGLPLSLAFLLHTLKRPVWPALLSLPFAYGDSLAWGFINYCSALPLAFLTCALFLRTLTEPLRRRSWAIALAFSLAAVLLFHVQVFAWLAVALPVLLLTTRVPEDVRGMPLKARLMPRIPALLGVIPGVAMSLLWVGLRVDQGAQVEAGAPWKAWGPMLSPQNLAWKSFDQNVAEFPAVLANMLSDQSDRRVLTLVVIVAIAGVLAGVYSWLGDAQKTQEWKDANGLLRLALLAAAAVALYLLLPFDIRGYMYYLNTRYAHLVAPLVLVCIPATAPKLERPFLIAGVIVAAFLCFPLYQGFQKFNAEARDLDVMEAYTLPKARVMGFVFDSRSRVVGHPVYLHSGAELARVAGGYANFSFALTPHSPLKYARTPPPAPPSEWNPGQFDWNGMAWAYDHFLIRGPSPEQLFGPKLGNELDVVARSGPFSLVRRK